jgi:hypothetical protein
VAWTLDCSSTIVTLLGRSIGLARGESLPANRSQVAWAPLQALVDHQFG